MSDPDPPSRRALLRESTDRRRFVRNAGVVAVGGTATMGLLRGGGGRRGPAGHGGLSEKDEATLSDALSRPSVGPVADALGDRGHEVAFERGRSSELETEQGSLSIAIAPFDGGRTGEFAATRTVSEPYLATVSDGDERDHSVLRGEYEAKPGRLHVREFTVEDDALVRNDVRTVPLNARLDDRLEPYVDDQAAASNADADDSGGVGQAVYTGDPEDCSPGLPDDIGCVGPTHYCCDINWTCAGQIMAAIGCTLGWRGCLATMGPIIGNWVENGMCHPCECCKYHWTSC